MKILLIGKNGQLGWELNRALIGLGELISLDFPQFNITDENQVRFFIRSTQPDLIINASAYTDVEKGESNWESAYLINSKGPLIIAEEASRIKSVFFHFSTDYVFNGLKGFPYVENDQTNPLNNYGKSKLEGERLISNTEGANLIFRTSWVYSMRGNSFVTKFLSWISNNHHIKVVDDQISNPTWARSLAEITAHIISRNSEDVFDIFYEKKGIYHLAGDGYCSRYEWAKQILDITGQSSIELVPTKSDDFPTIANRPLFSALNCNKFTEVFEFRLPNWKTSLELALAQ